MNDLKDHLRRLLDLGINNGKLNTKYTHLIQGEKGQRGYKVCCRMLKITNFYAL